LANPDQYTDDMIVLTDREIARMCAALDHARTNNGRKMLAEFSTLYLRWTKIANDDSTLIVSDPTVGGHRMHAALIRADERHRLRLAVDAYTVVAWNMGDDQGAEELYELAERLGGAL
jgi:hypothetical protein